MENIPEIYYIIQGDHGQGWEYISHSKSYYYTIIDLNWLSALSGGRGKYRMIQKTEEVHEFWYPVFDKEIDWNK